MSKLKKSYVKPEITIIPVGSPRYNEIMALLKAEATNIMHRENIPPPPDTLT